MGCALLGFQPRPVRGPARPGTARYFDFVCSLFLSTADLRTNDYVPLEYIIMMRTHSKAQLKFITYKPKRQQLYPRALRLLPGFHDDVLFLRFSLARSFESSSPSVLS